VAFRSTSFALPLPPPSFFLPLHCCQTHQSPPPLRIVLFVDRQHGYWALQYPVICSCFSFRFLCFHRCTSSWCSITIKFYCTTGSSVSPSRMANAHHVRDGTSLERKTSATCTILEPALSSSTLVHSSSPSNMLFPADNHSVTSVRKVNDGPNAGLLSVPWNAESDIGIRGAAGSGGGPSVSLTFSPSFSSSLPLSLPLSLSSSGVSAVRGNGALRMRGSADTAVLMIYAGK